MKVLLGIDTFGLVGGTERYAAVVVPALVERGHEVRVLCRAAPAGDFLRDCTGEPLVVPALEGSRLSRRDAAQLAARVGELAPDVAYLQSIRNVDAVGVLAERAPVVRYVHDHTLFCPGLNKVHEDGELCDVPMGGACLERYWLRGGCICFKRAQHRNPVLEPLKIISDRMREVEVTRRASRVLTNSSYMRGELLQAGFAPERTSVLYPFTRSNTPAQPAGPLPPATEAWLAAGEEPLLFTPTRLALPDKGVDFLLTALGSVRGPFRAVVAGAGPAEAWLREKAVREGLGARVHFAGWLGSPAVEALFARADAVVCPSVWNEPFGLVGIEAYAHGKPVVAFRVGGIPEWLRDGETGFLVPRKDTAAMAAAVERVLGDRVLARALGARGRALAARDFGAERHMQGLEEALAAAAA